jgi:ribosomal protein S18 acetylase RimI-like enzyme
LQITYKVNPKISSQEFIDLLKKTSLGERRPLDNPKIIEDMLAHADILITANLNDKIIAIARSVTDFSFCCYLSDLAVDESYQKMKIGQTLIDKTIEQLQPSCKLILLAAPLAVDYYGKIGFEKHPSAWTKN